MNRILTAMCVAVAAVGFGVIAISQAAPSGRSAKAGAHKAGAASDFAVLRTGRTAASSAGDALPASTSSVIAEPTALTSEYELEPTASSYVRFDANTHGWVIPGRKGICLAVSEGLFISRLCDSLTRVDAAGIVIASKTGSGATFYGLVPDGATVTAVEQDGSRINLQTSNNVFMDANPMTVSVAVREINGATFTTTAR